MKSKKIVLTGGPCAGKSTAMNKLHEVFSARGYNVLMIPETASELIGGGVAPWTCRTNVDFQQLNMHLQLKKEEVFDLAAANMNCDQTLIVCDRGVLDDKAYMTDAQYETIIHGFGFDREQMLHRYDAVFHMVTVAKSDCSFYTTSNNASRTEIPEEAIRLDDAVIEAWRQHPYFRIIDNDSSFEAKIDHLIREISDFLESEQV